MEENNIKCPNCNSPNFSKEFGEVAVCNQCGHKFNTHQKENFSAKYFVLGIAFIAGLFGFIYFYIPKFDEEAAMNELLQQQTNHAQDNYNEKKKSTTKQIEFATPNKIWITQLTETAENNTLELIELNPVTKQQTNTLLIDNWNNNANSPTINSITLNNKLIICINNINIYIIDLNNNKVIKTNDNFTAEFSELKNGFDKVEIIKTQKAVLIQNTDGNQFYYFPTLNKLLSMQQLEQFRKAEQYDGNWQFEKVYIAYQTKLYSITKKKLNYSIELTDADIKEILEGADWLRKSYGISSMEIVLPTSNFGNCIALFNNDSEVILVNENQSKIYYYNTSTQQTWHRTIDNLRNQLFNASIDDNKVIFYHQKNAYLFNKKNGELIWKY